MADKLHIVDMAVCMPLILIFNFSLFQYLLTTFWKRRRDRRVRLLFVIAFLSFACVIPFAFPGEDLARNLNGISEVCSLLTFLVQIIILTRDIGKRIKIRSIWILMWVGEVLTVVSLAMLITDFLDLIAPVIDMDVVEAIDYAIEYASLIFIVGFRFYFLAMIKGYRKVLASQKKEIMCYTLFLTHGVPFHILSDATGWPWGHVKGIWMRITIAACLWFTVKSRFSSQSSKMALATTNGPKTSQLDHTSIVGRLSDTAKTTTVAGTKGPFVRKSVTAIVLHSDGTSGKV